MFERRSLKLPIMLGVTMIVLLVALTVGWVTLAISGAMQDSRYAPLYWTLLSVGTAFLLFVLVGVIMYLTLTIKSINISRRQSNFIDSVTHELKSPIASLKLYLQTLNRRQVAAAQREDFQRFMLEDIERLDHLINHLLDVGRIDKGTAMGDVGDVRLDQVIDECVDAVCTRYRVDRAIVTRQLEPCLVRARHLELVMIFRNLIDNAVKYADEEPEVGVSLKLQPNERVVARISDNGRGIPQNLRRKVFGRFVRLGLELERQKPGTGLGLYIVRTLLRRLRGKVRVHDREGGSGTVFEVWLNGRAIPQTHALLGGSEESDAA